MEMIMNRSMLVDQGIVELLKLYPTIEQQIEDRTIEILNPYQVSDENIGGGSAGFISNPTEQSAVALCEDEVLNSLYYVEHCLDDVCRYFRTREFDYDKFVGMIEKEMNI